MIMILQLLLLLTLSLRTDGYYEYMVDECVFNSDLTEVEYIYTCYFNKIPDVQFNSTVGKFVGFTDPGLKYAADWNSNTNFLQQMRAQRDTYCKHNTQIEHSHVLVKSVLPKIRLRLDKQGSGDHPTRLACSAYNFYPPAIDVYWLKDGKKVTGDVTATEEMSDGDWYYQFHSHLEYTPESGEKISCVVEHASSTRPIITDWDPSLPETDRNKIAIGSSGLVLGLILSAAGFIYYKKKSTGRILVPS